MNAVKHLPVVFLIAALVALSTAAMAQGLSPDKLPRFEKAAQRCGVFAGAYYRCVDRAPSKIDLAKAGVLRWMRDYGADELQILELGMRFDLGERRMQSVGCGEVSPEQKAQAERTLAACLAGDGSLVGN
ncbi:MAG: hypothetical protein ACE5H8_00835 [Alphaproteobacteria bacterium]